MAPKQPTIKDAENIFKQILILVDAIEYKTCEALFNMYRERMEQEGHLIKMHMEIGEAIPEETREALELAYYQMRTIQLVNKFKKARQQLREEYLKEIT